MMALIKMVKSSVLALIIFGVFFHLVLLYSIFDIYYSTSHATRTFPITNGRGPASRLIFFSVDNLRARTFFRAADKSPFLHGLIKEGKTAWGILTTSTLSGSRSGHVAFMAGFYENVETRGRRYDSVELDSIVNQSTNIWLWDSHDIKELFDGVMDLRLVYSAFFSTEIEKSVRKDTYELNKLIFDNIHQYFTELNSTNHKIFADKSLFILHLFGLETTKHKTESILLKYDDNIRIIDEGIRRTVNLFQRFYNDDRTAFIFTADSGITNWNGNGSATDDELRVPFMAWGAGVRASATQVVVPLNQVDVAPLQAALLGIAVPANNVGILPLSLLNASSTYRFKAAYANLKQLSGQYLIKREEKLTNSLPFMFHEYSGFGALALVKVDAEIRRLADLRRFDAATAACIEWIPRVRDALMYFHRYKQFNYLYFLIPIYALPIFWNLRVLMDGLRMLQNSLVHFVTTNFARFTQISKIYFAKSSQKSLN